MNRSGEFVTNLSGETAYKSFKPSKLPPVPQITLDNDTVNLLVSANKQLAVLESISARIPNVDLFVSMYVRKEALLSSQIEGTQATLDDVLDPEVLTNTNQNVKDVVNYIKATEFSIARLNSLPLCNRLIKETHKALMENVRGQEKNPGEFRYSQNWIGGEGSSLKTARYIPPNVEDMNDAMSDLEIFMNEDDDMDLIIKAALIHYQFETIHPFLDGNGRIGRLLITLFLMEKKVLSTPALYISYFLKKNRIEYYDRMTEVRNKGNYEQWIKFFLSAIWESSIDATETIDKLIALHNRNIEAISDAGKSLPNVTKLFLYLEKSPIIEIKKTSEILSLSYNTVAKAVDFLIKKGILVQNKTTGKTRTFSYEEYLGLLRKDC